MRVRYQQRYDEAKREKPSGPIRKPKPQKRILFIIALLFSFALSEGEAQEMSPAQFESFLQEIRVGRQSEAFRRNRAGIFKQIEIRISGMEESEEEGSLLPSFPEEALFPILSGG